MCPRELFRIVIKILQIATKDRSRHRRKVEAERRRKEEAASIDHFDRLPDSLVLEILNCIGGAKVLGRCCVVSRRFHALVPLVHNIIFPTGFTFADATVYALNCFLGCHYTSDIVSRWPQLNSFLDKLEEHNGVHITFPDCEYYISDRVIYKWKVELRPSLSRVVVFAATSPLPSRDPIRSFDSSNLTEYLQAANGNYRRQRKLLIGTPLADAWNWCSSLQPVMTEYQKLQTVIVTDADGQRVLIVDREWVLEAVPKSLRAWLWPKKTRVWCAEKLELPCGTAYRDATLMVSITNADVPTAELPEDHDWICDGFGGPYKEAMRMMLQRESELLVL
ncbi:F-box protein At5g46170-like [Curcuma longa]|uniref:F-box protein At5g46170-like n=1 Tax=Curcuma longa TaxID=136217 RepID=UPI003D9E1D65